MMYRFDKTAILHKAILSNDDEQLRPAVKGTPFRCFEQTLKTKGAMTVLDGSKQGTVSLTLQTDNEDVALSVEADDQVEFEGHTYIVGSVGAVRSLAHRGAKEYLIGLL